MNLIDNTNNDFFTNVNSEFKIKENLNEPYKVLITGAAGNIGYSISFMIGQGRMFGPQKEIILHQPNQLTEHIEVRIDNEKDTIWLTQKQMGKMNYNVPSRNTVVVPSRASGTKQIMVVEALAVVEALETTVMSKELIVMCS